MNCEVCEICRQPFLTVWRAPDKIWAKVTNNSLQNWCLPCFEAYAKGMDISLYWECEEDEFPSE